MSHTLLIFMMNLQSIPMKIAFVNTYPPRKCGIASFSANLIEAFKDNFKANNKTLEAKIVAVNQENISITPNNANLNINQEFLSSYINVAKNLNYHATDLCIIQHEYGIFGGDCGLYILPFIYHLNCRVIVTLHNVLEEPTFSQKNIIKKINEQAENLVVMNVTASRLLQTNYDIDSSKIEIIEHGIPNLEPINKLLAREIIGLKQQHVLLSFGLLSRNKGIETVINALPEIIKIFPNLVYVILGNTHPSVLKHDGDEYRNYLSILIREKKLNNHVQFHNEFVNEKRVIEYISAADLFITPYNINSQVTSGTMSYGFGLGSLVISTPFLHAKELLKENSGVLFDFKDYEQLSTKVIQLLSDPDKMNQIKNNAYKEGRNFTWEKIGEKYAQLANHCISNTAVNTIKPHKHNLIDISLLPDLNLSHLKRLTDDTGIIQHAKYGIPNLKEGYCLDDNARALVTALMAFKQTKDTDSIDLIPIYLSYIHYMQKPSGIFRNFMSFSRQFLDETGSEDAFGRTIWSLGYLVKHAPKDAFLEIGKEIYCCALPNFDEIKSLRAVANIVIGISYYVQKFPLEESSRECLNKLTQKLTDSYSQAKTDDWVWFEDLMTYDNGILPLALFLSSEITGNENVKQIAIDSTAFLVKHTFESGYLTPIGNEYWFVKEKEKSIYDQQAIDVMAMVLLFYEAYKATKNNEYLSMLNTSYLWFLGENSLRMPLYDHETHGCCDGLEKHGVNRNQGAESTLAYLISHLTVLEALNLQIQL